MYSCHSILECCVMFMGVKLSIRSFVLFLVYFDLTFIIDTGGKLLTRLYDKRDDFDFYIVNFSFLSSWPLLWCVHFTAH